VSVAARFALALWRFWLVYGHLTVGRQWLERAVALVANADDVQKPITAAECATLLHVTGNLARAQGDYAQASRLQEAGLAIRQRIGDLHGIGVSLHNLGAIAYEQGIMYVRLRLATLEQSGE
jgi:hypothetical protein